MSNNLALPVVALLPIAGGRRRRPTFAHCGGPAGADRRPTFAHCGVVAHYRPVVDDTSPRVCYRHPDRETRLACSNCGRPICVECSRDAAVGQKCPDCSSPEGRHKVITAAQMRQTRAGSPLTYVLIAINVLVFFAGELDPSLGRRMLLEGAHLPALISAGEWWRAFTAMFL